MSKSNFNNEKPIPGHVLKKAFDGFDSLGIATKQILIEDLEQKGIIFDEKHSYSLDRIALLLTEQFGKDGTVFLTERLKRILDNLKWAAISMLPTLQFGFLCITKGCVCFFCVCPDMASVSMEPM